jgi:hypothetical protein
VRKEAPTSGPWLAERERERRRETLGLGRRAAGPRGKEREGPRGGKREGSGRWAAGERGWPKREEGEVGLQEGRDGLPG